MSQQKEMIFVPTLYELIYCTLLGSGLLIASVLISAVKDYDIRYYNFFSTSAKTFIDTKLEFLESPKWATIITFVLWMICGILVYLAVWFVSTVIAAYREDSLPLHGFLTPRGYNRQDEIFTIIARGLIRFMGLNMTIVWIIILIRTIMPYLTKVFATSLSPFGFTSLPTLVVASVMLGVCFYIQIVLIRFIFLRKRLFSSSVIA